MTRWDTLDFFIGIYKKKIHSWNEQAFTFAQVQIRKVCQAIQNREIVFNKKSR
jgi:hypothetical protein